MSDVPEFSRPVSWERLGRNAFHEKIAADPEECAALAARFRIPAIGALSAELTLRPGRAPSLIEVEGQAMANVTQVCVVTGELFASDVKTAVKSLFTAEPPQSYQTEPGLEIDSDWDDPETVTNGMIDLGELAAQHIALMLDPYPRKPGAAWREVSSGDDAASVSPFRVLDGLKKT